MKKLLCCFILLNCTFLGFSQNDSIANKNLISPTNVLQENKLISPSFKCKSAVGVHLSTNGIGVSAIKAIRPHWYISLEGAILPIQISRNLQLSGIPSKADVSTTCSHLDLIATWAPFKAKKIGIQLGGTYFFSALVTTTIAPNATYTINGYSLSSEQIGDLTIKSSWKGFAPYAGINFGNPFNGKHWHMVWDLGTYFMQAPKCTSIGSKRLSDNEAIGVQLTQNLNDYRWFPKLGCHLFYTF